jgi:hypothetical protein
VACADYIDPNRELSLLRVVGREIERIGVAEGDVIYVGKGRVDGIQAGMEYAVIRGRRDLAHPTTSADLGRIVHRLGRARILCAQENTATAVIVDSCEPIQDGDELPRQVSRGSSPCRASTAARSLRAACKGTSSP